MIEKVDRERSRGCEGRVAAQGQASVEEERWRVMRKRKAFIPTTRLPEDQVTGRAMPILLPNRIGKSTPQLLELSISLRLASR